MTSSPIRIATRASRLALWQANHVADRLRAAAPQCRVELVTVATAGDRDRSGPLTQFGDTGVFTREVQRAVQDGRADVAVHSLKDLPTAQADGLTLGAVPARESVFDALVLPVTTAIPPGATGGLSDGDLLDALASGARVGTGSPRRKAQLLHARPDLRVENVRGNVETRLRKLDDGEYDALVLAEAGLRRLDFAERISVRLGPPLVFPAVGQGALGIECRTSDAVTIRLLGEIDDAPTRAAVTAERTLLAELRAGCHAPVGVQSAVVEGGRMELTAVVLSADGTERLISSESGPLSHPEQIGIRVAQNLLDRGAARLMGDDAESQSGE